MTCPERRTATSSSTPPCHGRTCPSAADLPSSEAGGRRLVPLPHFSAAPSPCQIFPGNRTASGTAVTQIIHCIKLPTSLTVVFRRTATFHHHHHHHHLFAHKSIQNTQMQHQFHGPKKHIYRPTLCRRMSALEIGKEVRQPVRRLSFET